MRSRVGGKIICPDTEKVMAVGDADCGFRQIDTGRLGGYRGILETLNDARCGVSQQDERSRQSEEGEKNLAPGDSIEDQGEKYHDGASDEIAEQPPA